MRVLGWLLFRLPEIAVGLVTAAIAVLINVQVALRYIFNAPTGWTDEWMRLLALWVIFLGTAVAVGRGSHIGLHIIANYLSRRQLRWLNSVVFLLIIIFGAITFVYATQATQTAFGQYFTMTGVPVGWQYLSGPVGLALMLIYSIRNLVNDHDPIPSTEVEETGQ